MTKSKTRETVKFREPDKQEGRLKALGGSMSDEFNTALANQAVNALWLAHADAEERDQQFGATLAALAGVAPRDPLEGMLAAQMVATHSAAMECFRRAMLKEQTLAGREQNLGHATKLVRSYAALLEALNKHRGKGQQVVRVEHVTVNAGGQAIVGAVTHPGGGDERKSEGQPHAKRLAYAPEPALRGTNEDGGYVPVTGSDRADTV